MIPAPDRKAGVRPVIQYLSFLLLYVYLPFQLYAYENGFKFFSNYSTGLNSQNWSIRQGSNGLIYVANNGKVIEYDGISQRKIDIPNKSARSLAVDRSGTIYVGGINQFGYLAANETGYMQYVSLVDHLSGKQKSFGIVYSIHATTEGIYFRTKKYLFRLQPGSEEIPGEIKVWPPLSGTFDASFYIRGTYYIHSRGVGLMEMNHDALKLIPNSPIFQQVKIYMLIPFAERKILMGTRSRGFFLFDPEVPSIAPFKTGLDDYLLDKKLSHGIHLSKTPDTFILATLEGGAVSMDTSGRLKEIFDRTFGLSGNVIYHAYEDRQGNLWLGHDKGLSKIEYHSPLSVYNDSNSKLEGIVLSVARHGPERHLYVGTNQGMLRLEQGKSPELAGKFLHVPGTAGMYFALLSRETSLLAATDHGVKDIKYDRNQKRFTIQPVTQTVSYVLLHSRKHRDFVWVGTSRGLVSIQFKENRWQEAFQLKTIPHQIRTMVEDNDGNLWIGTRTRGVFHIRFPAGHISGEAGVTAYGEAHGLPPGEIRVFWAAGRVIAASEKKVFRFDKIGESFLPDDTFGKSFTEGSRSIFRLKEDKDGIIWFHSEFKNLAVRPGGKGFYTPLDNPLHRLPSSQVNQIYLDSLSNAIWFAANDGLFRFDRQVKKDYHLPFSTLVRQVEVNGKVIYAGAAVNGLGVKPRTLSYEDRNIRFKFAAPHFEDESAIRFQSILEGYDEKWSPWSESPQKNYTNLDPGQYHFRVKAMNSYQFISREGTYSFKVLPPWYWTWWAYVIYTALLIISMALLVRWRSAKLHKETIRLEGIIKKRTGEIQDKNKQLEEQSEKLKEMDRVKSRFFANISHEFRTPLTLIMGPLEQMLGENDALDKPNVDSPVNRKRKLTLMLRNSQRLLHLINQLLDLSKLESGTLTLQASPQPVVPFVKGVVESFELAARQKELSLIFKEAVADLTLYFDSDLLEEVLCNLLGNALKFTPAGGEVGIEISCSTDSKLLNISIKDNGPGIPREQLVNIFDRFYQAGTTFEHHRKGTGIGLAIAKELVELHRGSIDVHSREDEQSGTSFVIHLPIGKNHLNEEEILETPASSEPKPVSRNLPVEISEPEPAVKEEITADADKPIILVVEDSSDMREFIRGSLEPEYQVIEAIDGNEGIEKSKEIIPDLIISDIMMPGADGYELCRVLKNRLETSHIPIILLTAKTADDSVIEGLETGADDYITKPFNTRILNARIKNLIALRLQLQESMQREMNMQPVKMPLSPIDETFLADLKDTMEKNIEDPDFNVDGLGKKMYMSRPTLYRKIKALIGQTPTDYIRDYRLKKGADLLKRNFGNITEVAFEVGFSSAAYFTKCFRDKFHILPSSFLSNKSKDSSG